MDVPNMLREMKVDLSATGIQRAVMACKAGNITPSKTESKKNLIEKMVQLIETKLCALDCKPFTTLDWNQAREKHKGSNALVQKWQLMNRRPYLARQG